MGGAYRAGDRWFVCCVGPRWVVGVCRVGGVLVVVAESTRIAGEKRTGRMVKQIGRLRSDCDIGE